MKTAYVDCFSGVAGDMLLAALLDAGVPLDAFTTLADRLKLPGVTLAASRVKRHGLAAMHVAVTVDPSAQKKHRHLSQIVRIIDEADLPLRVAQRAKAAFERLAQAEATVHGSPIEKVHFHEVGANDAIVDIVGVCLGFELLGAESITCSPIPTGNGTVRCEHGEMPVPAPATAQLLRGVPIASCAEQGELATPTGVALMTTLAESFGPIPAMRVGAIGVGAGTREGATRPNVLRILVGETDSGATRDGVVVLETQVDDATGQNVAFAMQRLMDEGALDVFAMPIMMKKGRPAHLLTVLCRAESAAELERVLFDETGTLGVRRRWSERSTLLREHASMRTAFGEIRVKVARRDGRVVRVWPEYDDCAEAARRCTVPLHVVQQAAIQAWTEAAGGAAG